MAAGKSMITTLESACTSIVVLAVSGPVARPWTFGRLGPRASIQRVQKPWGSQSTTVGGGPRWANQPARLVASVVFPQPPLGFMTTILCRPSAPEMLITVRRAPPSERQSRNCRRPKVASVRARSIVAPTAGKDKLVTDRHAVDRTAGPFQRALRLPLT